MRCDDIFERSGTIINSRCRKKKSFILSNKFELRYKASSSSNSKPPQANPKSLSPLHFTFSPSNPQIEGAAAGRAWLLACAGKVEKRRATFVDTYARDFGWWFIYGCSVPKLELEHTYFISFPQIDPLSLLPDPFVDQLPRWVHSDIKFHVFGFYIFLHFAWKSPVSQCQCELINYWKSVWIRLHIICRDAVASHRICRRIS